MKNLVLSFLFLITAQVLSAQNSHLVIKGYVDNEKQERLKNCALQIFMDDVLVKVDTTDQNGMYSFDSLYVGHVYDVYFEAEGYSLKFVRLDVKKAKLSDLVRYPLELNMALFSTEGMNMEKLSFMQSEPYALAKYNTTTDGIDWDLVYLEKMKKRVDAIRNE